MVDHGATRPAALHGAPVGALDQAEIGDHGVFKRVAIVQPNGLTAREDLTAFLVHQGEIVSIVLQANTPVTTTDGAGIVDPQARTRPADRVVVAAFDQARIVDRLIRSAELHRASFCADDLRIAFDGDRQIVAVVVDVSAVGGGAGQRR